MRPEIVFLRFLRSGAFRKGPGFRRLRRLSRIIDFQKFYDTFLLVFAILFCRLRADFVRVCRVPPGFCRDPHPDAVIHSPFSPGVRRFAQRFKFAVPQRGAGRVKPTKGGKDVPGRFTLPFLPAGRPRIAVPYRGGEGNRSFFDFFRFFSRRKKRRKTRSSKNYFFRTFLRFRLAPASIFGRFRCRNGFPEVTFSACFRKRPFRQNRAPA